MTPTVKKEIHVWRRNSDGVVTDVEVVGTFYVQVKRDYLPLVITDIRSLTKEELTASRVPAGPGENPREIEFWYKRQGR